MPNPIDVVEALLFASDVPLEAERIREVLDLENAAAARALVDGADDAATRPSRADCRSSRWAAATAW